MITITPVFLNNNKLIKKKSPEINYSNTNYIGKNNLILPGINSSNILIPRIKTVSFKGQENFEDTLEMYYRFKPDEYQKNAAKALFENKNTIVAAPTGTGKTLIAEYVINKNLAEGKKTFYTTPLKALSNQKYKDFSELFGSQNVGLATGDIKINTDAPVVVMTTEIFRNMLVSNQNNDIKQHFDKLNTVVFDEFHYLNDPERGTVWEESIILSPDNVQMLALSATASNADKITDWIKEIHSGKDISIVDVPESNRHVPLEYYVFDGNQINPIAQSKNVIKSTKKQTRELQHFELIKKLQNKDMLPAIDFVFSKKGCDDLAKFMLKQDFTLLNPDEEKEVAAILQKHESENKVKTQNYNKELLLKGFATHHAGLLPQDKALVEELFQKKLIKVVFATETLAAGINMPAKTTIISQLDKPGGFINGEMEFRPLMNSEFKQMAGRAGRRGIDTKGNVIVISNFPDDLNIAKQIIDSESEPIASKFTPSYFFLANYFESHKDKKPLNELINKSFKVYSLPKENRPNVVNEVNKEFKILETVLKDRKFIETNEKGFYELTTNGSIITKI
ncbi:MAG: DEAD/DEAH box helicase, partial [Candidatus Gastranaerophilales bacterium]|nr:DEAD/DEAH box helicase [Candidatus Gastranaerophilales bacterium]